MRGKSTDHRYLAHAITWCAESTALNGKPIQRRRLIRTSSRT
jgi:hypothetical protein